MKALDFTLPDQNGKSQALSDYRGKWILLYFYPKDNTPGCTTEACSIRDEFNSFQKAGIVVLGVSADSVVSHSNFSEKYRLPFLLLSDQDKTVVTLYQVLGKKKFMGREYIGIKRESFLINPEGVIVKHYTDVKPAEHAREILAEVLAYTKKNEV